MMPVGPWSPPWSDSVRLVDDLKIDSIRLVDDFDGLVDHFPPSACRLI